MNVKNCRRCGKIYAYDGFRICKECRNADIEDFKRVKEYIYDNPNATIGEVAEEAEVSEKKIFEFLRQGKLELKSENGNLFLDCEKCGVPISSGRFCDKCTASLQRELQGSISTGGSAAPIKKSNDSNRMFTANRRK